MYALAPDGAGPASTPSLRWSLSAALAALGVFGVQIVRFLVLDVAFYRTQGHRAPALLHVVVALALYFALGLLIAGGVFGQSLTGAIATSAVASVVLGLALQETLGNFFAGIALQIERPFGFGDVIRTDGVEGRVESFNWRATTVQTIDDSRVVLPNALVARGTVEVFARSRPGRRRVVIPAPYATPPQRIVGVVRDALVGVPGIAERPAPQVRVAAFGESSVDYEVLYWVRDHLRAAATDAVVRERVWYAFAREDVSIPYPHQVQVPYEPPPPPTDDPTEERLRWLREVPLLAPLSSDEIRRLAERSRTCLYGPGETIIRAGAQGGSMFVVYRGRVAIYVPRREGGRAKVAEVGPGEVIGEMSLLTGEPRSADARAVDEVAVIEVRRPEMKGVLEQNGALAEALACEVSGRLDRRADALAALEPDADASAAPRSLLHRIRHFFDLDGAASHGGRRAPR